MKIYEFFGHEATHSKPLLTMKKNPDKHERHVVEEFTQLLHGEAHDVQTPDKLNVVEIHEARHLFKREVKF